MIEVHIPLLVGLGFSTLIGLIGFAYLLFNQRNAFRNRIPKRRFFRLTPRQTQVMILLAMGKMNKEIAEDLGMGCNTVKQHMIDIFKKLGVSSRTEAVIKWMSEGIRISNDIVNVDKIRPKSLTQYLEDNTA